MARLTLAAMHGSLINVDDPTTWPAAVHEWVNPYADTLLGTTSYTSDRNRRSFFGNSGSTNSHNSSETIHGATAIGTPPSLTTDADGVRRPGTGPFIQK